MTSHASTTGTGCSTDGSPSSPAEATASARGIARLFAQHGALVEVAEIDQGRADRIRDEVTGAGGSIRSHVVDVTVDDDVARLADAVLSATGGSTCW